MRIWLSCFLVLFAIAQLFDWLEQLKLPLPIYILGGAFLAIASNYNKLLGSLTATAEPPTVISSNHLDWQINSKSNLLPQQPAKSIPITHLGAENHQEQ